MSSCSCGGGGGSIIIQCGGTEAGSKPPGGDGTKPPPSQPKPEPPCKTAIVRFESIVVTNSGAVLSFVDGRAAHANSAGA